MMSVTKCECPCHTNQIQSAEKYLQHGCCLEWMSDQSSEISEPYVGGEI